MKKIILMAVVAIMAAAVSTAAPKTEKQIVTTVFVTDIDCEGCAKKITNTIPYERGIKNLKVEDTENGVVISGIAVIPEPTTATLSLLALAALAARRRRK